MRLPAVWSFTRGVTSCGRRRTPPRGRAEAAVPPTHLRSRALRSPERLAAAGRHLAPAAVELGPPRLGQGLFRGVWSIRHGLNPSFELVPLRPGEERGPVDQQAGIGHPGFQQPAVLLQQADDGGGIEQLADIVEAAADSLVHLHDAQRQVEQGGRGAPGQSRKSEARKVDFGPGIVLQHETSPGTGAGGWDRGAGRAPPRAARKGDPDDRRRRGWRPSRAPGMRRPSARRRSRPPAPGC